MAIRRPEVGLGGLEPPTSSLSRCFRPCSVHASLQFTGRADVPLSARDCRSGPAASGTDVARLVSHTSAREILQALGGELAVQQAGGLADLDEVSIRVPHVAADLRAAVDRRR